MNKLGGFAKSAGTDLASAGVDAGVGAAADSLAENTGVELSEDQTAAISGMASGALENAIDKPDAAAAKKGLMSGMLGKIGLGGDKKDASAAAAGASGAPEGEKKSFFGSIGNKLMGAAKDQAISAAQDAATDAIGEDNPLAGKLAENAIGAAGDNINLPGEGGAAGFGGGDLKAGLGGFAKD